MNCAVSVSCALSLLRLKYFDGDADSEETEFSMKIKRNDEVIVISGKDRGRRGKVLRVLDSDRVVVSGINMVKRHTRANPQMNSPGGILEKEAPLHVSKVAIADPETGKPSRVGYKTLEDGTKVRVARPSGSVIDG